MNIVKINYLDTFVPNMSCGTGYSEPDLFQVICDDGTAKVVDIDIWYRTEDSAIAEFYRTMRTEFPNCDNLEGALGMWKTTLQSTDRCPYFWMNEKEKKKYMKNTWWVEFQYTYEIQDYETNELVTEEDFESGRFPCLKKDIPKEVKQYIEEVLLAGENYRNLQVKILDKYITSDCEL